MTYKFKLSRRLAILRADRLFRREHVMLPACLAACLFACSPRDSATGPGHESGDTTVTSIIVSPDSTAIDVNETAVFSAMGRSAVGDQIPVTVLWHASGGAITPDGSFSAADTGTFQVTGQAQNSSEATGTAIVTVQDPRRPVNSGPEWTVRESDGFLEAENAMLRLKFAYGGPGSGGWFQGGGGRDGGIVELYYKPTSSTRNLIFRNGTFGGKYDQLDLWEAEPAAVDQADHNTPDFASGTDAVLNSHRSWEDAGRLFVESDFQFQGWHIVRTHIVYPWGDITVSARLTMTTEGRWNYLAHRFLFPVSLYHITNGQTYEWGGNYQNDADYMYAWSDVYGPNGTYAGMDPYQYSELIRPGVNRNTAISMFGRRDPYSGFLIDDVSGNDPDIVVMNGDSATWFSPFDQKSGAIGGTNYVETALFSPTWAPDHETHADLTWFYATIPCCPPQYGNPMLWPTSLGTWAETFHVFLRRDIQRDDYLSLWKVRAAALNREAPTEVQGGHLVLNPQDRIYHIAAEPGVGQVQFRWIRSVTAPRAMNYRTAFLVESFDNAAWAMVKGATHPGVKAYRSAASGNVLVVLDGVQPAVPQPYVITVGK
jgi:hypothetical protein